MDGSGAQLYVYSLCSVFLVAVVQRRKCFICCRCSSIPIHTSVIALIISPLPTDPSATTFPQILRHAAPEQNKRPKDKMVSSLFSYFFKSYRERHQKQNGGSTLFVFCFFLAVSFFFFFFAKKAVSLYEGKKSASLCVGTRDGDHAKCQPISQNSDTANDRTLICMIASTVAIIITPAE
jgi:hypothetical protein